MHRNIIILIVLVFLYFIFVRDPSPYSINTLSVNQAWSGITYSKDLQMWVAVGNWTYIGGPTMVSSYGYSAYSYDSYHWITMDPSTGGLPYLAASVAYGMTPNGPLFVAGEQQNWNLPNVYTCATSTDGIHWSPTNSLPIGRQWIIHFSPVTSLFYALTYTWVGGGEVYSSPDGINWSFINTFSGFAPCAICEGPNELMAVGTQIYIPIPSTSFKLDLLTPGSTFNSMGSNLPAIGYKNPMFISVKFINGFYYTSAVTGEVYSSPDGINWTLMSLTVAYGGSLAYVKLIDYFNGLYIIGTDPFIYYTEDLSLPLIPCSIEGIKGLIRPRASSSGVNINGIEKLVITCEFNGYAGAITTKDGMNWVGVP
jgi:hypothetical protein